MKARLAYLTSPEPGAFLLNIQVEGEEWLRRYELSAPHLANIVIVGTALVLRETVQNRVDAVNGEMDRA